MCLFGKSLTRYAFSFLKYAKIAVGAMYMKEFLLVGLGGAAGAMLRYGMSMIPVKSEFPFMTLLINFLGADHHRYTGCAEYKADPADQ